MTTSDNEPKSANCIWMDAGVVGYKLCDRDFQCDQCPFDVVMRQPFPKAESDSTAGLSESTTKRACVRDRTPQEQLDTVLNSVFVPLESLSFPMDRTYHKGHTWVERSAEDNVLVGIDHIAANVLDSLVTVVLPQCGTHLTENAPFCWLIHPEGTITMHAPLSGAVLAANTVLVQHPELMLKDPYRSWIAHVQPDEPEFRSRDFLSGESISQETTRQLQSLRRQVADRCRQFVSLGPTLPDGGVALQTLVELVGRKAFLQIIGKMFRP